MPETPRFLEVDRLIHEPARLAILAVLSSCRSADFVFLHNITGLSKGNLSVQISRLEDAGLVFVEKVIEKKKTRTTVSLTKHGTNAVKRYWDTMDKIKKRTRSELMQRIVSSEV
jgi:DNA-binding MarR family transcriptional regulator